MTHTLTTAAREKAELERALSEHTRASDARTAELKREIGARALVLRTAIEGLDPDKLALARTILVIRGSFVRAGDDRLSVVQDAIRQLATGEPIRPIYTDLWRCEFGTKSYDRWHGQRCDCGYGLGPKHGSVIFSVGLTPAARAKTYADLTGAEVEAAIYYLANLERAQAAEREAAA